MAYFRVCNIEGRNAARLGRARVVPARWAHCAKARHAWLFGYDLAIEFRI
jgi:hypothetical protein